MEEIKKKIKEYDKEIELLFMRSLQENKEELLASRLEAQILISKKKQYIENVFFEIICFGNGLENIGGSNGHSLLELALNQKLGGNIQVVPPQS